MADQHQRVPENAPGRFYVDRTCIDCELCRELAPQHFARYDPGRYSYVVLQPSSPGEEQLCRQARDACPVEAIGSDGPDA